MFKYTLQFYHLLAFLRFIYPATT